MEAQTNASASEAALQRCSEEKVFWKYAANVQENTLTKCDFKKAAPGAWDSRKCMSISIQFAWNLKK